MAVEVKIKIEFLFKTDVQEYTAKIYLFLPTEEGRECLHHTLCNPKKDLKGIFLHPWIGDYENGARVIKEYVYGSSIEEVEARVESTLNEIKERLKEVFMENKRKLQIVPPPKEILLIFE